MRPFHYERPDDVSDATELATSSHRGGVPTAFLSGGTTLLDLMKLGVSEPQCLIDITALNDENLTAVERNSSGLYIGALVTMEELANDKRIGRDFPFLTESLAMAASGQLRNMARLGGNVLQRTRCSYFRDPSYGQCNKRAPGSGCAALDGYNRAHAVLGTSASCIATYAGDWAQALIALDAIVEVRNSSRVRSIPFASLHRLPGDTPHIETVLSPDELITGFRIPGRTWPRSRFVKVRDRQSYAFANASAAVALELYEGKVEEVRIGLGGVATIPWRAERAEAILQGQVLSEDAASAAAEAEFEAAVAREHNASKISLGKATLVRALLEARDMEIADD